MNLIYYYSRVLSFVEHTGIQNKLLKHKWKKIWEKNGGPLSVK